MISDDDVQNRPTRWAWSQISLRRRSERQELDKRAKGQKQSRHYECQLYILLSIKGHCLNLNGHIG